MTDNSAFIRYGQACFRYRGLLFPAAVLLVLIPSPPILGNAVVTSVVGMVIALAGQGIRVATIGLEYIIRGGKNHTVFAEKLVTGGLYAHVRNPMYFGNAFLLLGLAVASNSWVFFIGGIALGAAVHVGMIGAEEHFLRGKFGAEYERFCREVPRLLPRLAGLGRTYGAAGRFDWGRVVDKEFMQPIDWTSATALLSLVALWRAGQLRDSTLLLVLMAAVILARLVLWTVQRSRATARVPAAS
jgi:protein-S-isoprenylcysteine O-methyltransferase Ste14